MTVRDTGQRPSTPGEEMLYHATGMVTWNIHGATGQVGNHGTCLGTWDIYGAMAQKWFLGVPSSASIIVF